MKNYDRFEDALFTRATQINEHNPYPYIAGYLLSFVESRNLDFDNSIDFLEKEIQDNFPKGQDEQTLVDLMWQHEPLKQPLD